MRTIQEVYAGKTLEEIQASLEVAGTIAENARRDGKSLTQHSRQFILTAREAAKRYGLSQRMMSTIEAQGARLVRS